MREGCRFYSVDVAVTLPLEKLGWGLRVSPSTTVPAAERLGLILTPVSSLMCSSYCSDVAARQLKCARSHRRMLLDRVDPVVRVEVSVGEISGSDRPRTGLESAYLYYSAKCARIEEVSHGDSSS